nr:MAG TPA: hypothetical protein [Caudoviricetes sp.]
MHIKKQALLCLFFVNCAYNLFVNSLLFLYSIFFLPVRVKFLY